MQQKNKHPATVPAVLRTPENLPGFRDLGELERHEREALLAAYKRAAVSYSADAPFTSDDICNLHYLIFANTYEWAGIFRRSELSTDGIKWCKPRYIRYEMSNFRRMLERMTPLSPSLSRDELLSRLAEIHGELVAIHPFQDGNGRTARLLCDLLLMQADYPPIHFGTFDDAQIRADYHAAIREVWGAMDYTRLIALLDRVVAKKPIAKASA